MALSIVDLAGPARCGLYILWKGPFDRLEVERWDQ